MRIGWFSVRISRNSKQSVNQVKGIMANAQPNLDLKSFWRERIMGVVAAQLKQGISPGKVALTVALGVTLGIFPIMGATTLLCIVAGLCLKLNQPIMQLVNWLVSALQLALIQVFVRLGEWLTRAERVTFSIPELIKKFHESPRKFLEEFGVTGLHAIVGWLAVAPVLIPLLYFSVLPPLKKLAKAKILASTHAD